MITGSFYDPDYKLPDSIPKKIKKPRQSFDNLTPEKVKESENKVTELPLPAIPRRNGCCIGMKTQTYYITSGSEPYYLACLTGPKTPAISTLWKKFKKVNNLEAAFSIYDKFGDVTVESMHTCTNTRFVFEMNAGDTIEKVFIDMLMRDCGFVRTDMKRVNLS